ncbi:MAG TPA: hypothetical protein DCF71_04345 [Gemmatimonadetes bacterium]|nr:hypothetical protein [Gemmatimonadota bacterium]
MVSVKLAPCRGRYASRPPTAAIQFATSESAMASLLAWTGARAAETPETTEVSDIRVNAKVEIALQKLLRFINTPKGGRLGRCANPLLPIVVLRID